MDLRLWWSRTQTGHISILKEGLKNQAQGTMDGT